MNKTCLTCKYRDLDCEVVVCGLRGHEYAVTDFDTCDQYVRNENVDDRGCRIERCENGVCEINFDDNMNDVNKFMENFSIRLAKDTGRTVSFVLLIEADTVFSEGIKYGIINHPDVPAITYVETIDRYRRELLAKYEVKEKV